jgi:hypothetical protein
MKKNFTKLVSVGIACFCILSTMGQEKMLGVRVSGEKALVKDEVKLRAATEKQQPDSVVMYYDDGYKESVFLPYDVKYNSRGLVESMTYLEGNTYN